MTINERHRWFDDWRGAEGPALHKLVAEITTAIDRCEQAAGTRTRKRRENDQRHHLSAVEVTVANLAHAVLMPPETGRLAIITGNGRNGQTRYDNPALGKPFRTLLHGLDELGLAPEAELPTTRRSLISGSYRVIRASGQGDGDHAGALWSSGGGGGGHRKPEGALARQ